MTDTRTSLAILGLLAALAVPAFAQSEEDYGQDAKPIPRFDPKSKILMPEDREPGGPAAVNLGAEKVDRAAKILNYRYKGVDLPLKRYLEYEGSQPYVEIVDGKNTLWIAKRSDLNKMLDRVLYSELDALTGAADDLYLRHRFASAYTAYRDVLEVLASDKNDLGEQDLEHYPAVRSYLQLRMGQSRSWDGHQRWQDSERYWRKSEEARATAEAMRRDPTQGEDLARVWETIAKEFVASAEKAGAEGARLMAEAETLLVQSAARNDKLWQAHNELGILAAARAARLSVEGNEAGAEKELRGALENFRKARALTDAKELLDGNLVAIYSGLADIEHSRGAFDEALKMLERAMEVTNVVDKTPEDQDVTYEVAFTSFHPTRGETIVVTAELQAGLTRKYLSIVSDRSRGKKAVEAETAIPEIWTKQGETIMKQNRWRDAVGFYTGLYDAYGLGDPVSSATADFRTHVTKSLERSFGERATALLKGKHEDDALQLYALALNYIPNSRVLHQGHIQQAFRRADSALSSARWEDALRDLEKVEMVYASYEGKDAEVLKTRGELAARFGTAFVGLTKASMDRQDFDKAGGWAERAMHLDPPRWEWKENKAWVLYENARRSEKAGNLEGAQILYEEARKVGVRRFRYQAAFARDTVRAQLLLPKAKREILAATRSYGVFIFLGLVAMGVGVPATRGAMGAAARKRRARSLRNQAQRAYDAKSWNDAVDLFNDYLIANIGAVDAEVYELLARSYRKIGDFENALRYFERASNRMPGRHYNLERAEIYLMKRNLPLALKALRTSANVGDDAARLVHFLNYLREKDGESLFVTEALAQVQIAAGDFESGRQLYLRLLDLEPRNPKTLRALAEIARRAGEAKERRGYLEKLVSIESNDASSLRELGNLLAAEGDLHNAVEHLKKAHEIAPGEGLAARIAELQAEFLVREAENEIQRLGREQDTPNRRFRIGELHWKLGRGREAKVYFEEAAGVKEYQARALRYLGLIAMAAGDWQDAISLLRGYLAKRTNLAPDAAEKEARYALGEASEKSGQADQAGAQWEAIFEADPGYKDVARRMKQRLASGAMKRASGPVDCPFCKRRAPGDAEYCPHCNYHLAAGSPGRFSGTSLHGEITREGTREGTKDPTKESTRPPGKDDV